MNSTRKSIQYLLPATEIDMDGIAVKQALPTNGFRQVDPFLLLHHGTFATRLDAPARHQGIGPHPHRGFSPVTFVIEGEVQHRDSRGHNQIARKGDVQWMHAGAGIIHSERPSQALVDQAGRQEIVQLWINSPASSKLKMPSYQYLAAADMPHFQSKDEKMQHRLVAGKWCENSGKIQTESPLLVLWSLAEAGSADQLSISSEFNSCLYLIRGEIRVVGYGKVEAESLLVFDNNADLIEIEALSKADFLVLAGIPIGEKVTKHGPFVMNTQTEIMEAMRDYRMGKMGILIEED